MYSPDPWRDLVLPDDFHAEPIFIATNSSKLHARSLRVLKTGWTLQQRGEYFAWFQKAAHYKGGASMRGFLNLMLDESAASAERRWQRVLQALGRPKDIKWTGEPYALTQALTFDTGNKASILSCIIAARENSRHVREQISTEQWHRLNSLYLQVTRPELQIERQAEAQAAGMARPSEFLQSVMEAVHQFQGVTDSTMNHGEGWQFIQVGRYLERASATALPTGCPVQRVAASRDDVTHRQTASPQSSPRHFLRDGCLHR